MSKEFTPREKNSNPDNVSDWFQPQRHICKFIFKCFGTFLRTQNQAILHPSFGFPTWKQSANAVALFSVAVTKVIAWSEHMD